MTGMSICQLSYLHIEPVYKKPQNLHPLKSCTVGKYQLYIVFYITLILYIVENQLPIDMEYALKAEDIIGNSVVSEDDIPIYLKMIMVIVIERVMVRIIVIVIQKEMKGVMLQMATVVMLRLLIIMLGLQLMITLMIARMTMMMVMLIVVTIAALVTRAAHTVELSIMEIVTRMSTR